MQLARGFFIGLFVVSRIIDFEQAQSVLIFVGVLGDDLGDQLLCLVEPFVGEVNVDFLERIFLGRGPQLFGGAFHRAQELFRVGFWALELSQIFARRQHVGCNRRRCYAGCDRGKRCRSPG